MDTGNSISLLSAFAALGSAYWAWNSARSARRALALAEADSNSRRESLSVEHLNSLQWSKNGEEYVSIAATFSNSSALPTTVQRVELHVCGFDLQDSKSILRLHPAVESPDRSHISALETPINIDGRATKVGWLTFNIPNDWKLKYITDKYQLVATTWSGEQLTVDAYIVIRQESEE